MLLLFGYRDEKLAELSDHICTALQLTNFWQDLSIDLGRGRCYVPLEDMRRFGVSMEELRDRKQTEGFRSMMEFELKRTEDLFEQGRPLLGEVGRDLSFELKLTWLGGTTILKKIRAIDDRVLSQRPVLTLPDKGLLLFRALRGFPRRA
jgi:phytoene/squalene synthetase